MITDADKCYVHLFGVALEVEDEIEASKSMITFQKPLETTIKLFNISAGRNFSEKVLADEICCSAKRESFFSAIVSQYNSVPIQSYHAEWKMVELF